MDQTFRPLLDALKQIGVDPGAVDAAADGGAAQRPVGPRRPDQRPGRHRGAADHRGRGRVRHQHPGPGRLQPGPGRAQAHPAAGRAAAPRAGPVDVRRRDRRRRHRPGRRGGARRRPRRDRHDRPPGGRRPQRGPPDHRAAAARGQRPRRPGRQLPGRLGGDDRPGDQRRRRPDRALRQQPDRAGRPEPRLRPAPGADRGRHAGAVPDRRRAARARHRPARRDGGADLPAEDHVRASTSPRSGSRRTAASPC